MIEPTDPPVQTAGLVAPETETALPPVRLLSHADFWRLQSENGLTESQRKAIRDSLPHITTVPSPTRPPQE